MAREIPEQWKPLLESKGIGSFRALAAKSGVSVATTIRLLCGEGAPEPKTLLAVAAALEVDPNLILNLAGVAATDYGPVDWPAESRLLTPRQRDAVAAVIRSMVEPETVARTGKSGIRAVPESNVSDVVEMDTKIRTGKRAARTRRTPKE